MTANKTESQYGHRTGSLGQLRGQSVIRARFRLALPDDLWVSQLSTSYPDATFRLLTGVPKGDRALELGEVRTATPGEISAAIRNHPDILAYDKLYSGDSHVISQYEADEKSLYEFLWESSLPPEFPILVENGTMEFDVTATQPQFDAFGTMLDETGREYQLLTLVHTADRNDLLTTRQRECLNVAQRKGYFEVPRGCTLDDIAATLDVDKSSASETLRRAIGRIVGQFLMERD